MRSKIVSITKVTNRAFGSISIGSFGTPAQVLKLSSAPSPSTEPKLTEVKVSIKASQVLFEDLRIARGISSIKKDIGIAGSTAVGTVTGLSSSDGVFSLNDLVLLVGPEQGLWTDSVVISKSQAVKIPKLSPEDAALLPTAVSAWVMLNSVSGLKKGDTVLQTIGGSAVGLAISEIGKSMGLNVISLSKPDIEDASFVSKFTSKNAKLSISCLSGKVNNLLLKVLSDEGQLVTYNGQIESIDSSNGLDVPVGKTIFNNVSIKGFDFFTFVKTNPTGYKNALTNVLSLVESKQINLKTNKIYQQSDYLKAISDVETSGAAAIIKL